MTLVLFSDPVVIGLETKYLCCVFLLPRVDHFWIIVGVLGTICLTICWIIV